MFRIQLLIPVLLAVAFVQACSGGGNPIVPSDRGNTQGDLTAARELSSSEGRVLWGIYHVTLDPVSETAEIVPLRTAEVGVNVTRFLQPPSSPIHMISFNFYPGLSDYAHGLFVLDVTLKHPFPGLEMYRGFDVRGVFMSNATSFLPGDGSLTYPGGDDSRMLNPDGFTRWWNSTEFTSKSIFGYSPGKLGPPVYPDAILNPYKYFCDDIEAESPLSDVTLENRGTFSITSANTRRYEIQFRMDGDKVVFDFNYAVDASWEDLGPDAPSYEPGDFPVSANCQEPWWVEIDSSQSSLYFVEPGLTGGQLVLDVTVHDWQAALEDGGSVPAEIGGITMYSPILPDFFADIIGLGATITSEDIGAATWRLVMDADQLQITSQGEQEIWIAALSAEPDTYAPQIPGGDSYPHPDGPLAAYARGSVSIGGVVPQDAPSVLNVDPDSGYLDMTLSDVLITGSDFIIDGLTVEFSNGSYPIPVSNVNLVSDTEITVDLDLASSELGLYDVKVSVDNLSGPGSLEGSLPDGFEVLAPIDEYGWPNLGRSPLHNSLSEVNGPQGLNKEYSAAADVASAPETLLIGVDPDNPGDWLIYIGYYGPGKSFSAYRASDGSKKWTVNAPSGYSSLRVMAVAPPGVACPDNEQGTVYVWAYASVSTTPEKILALSATDGGTLWEYTAPGNGSWLRLERYGLVLDNGDFVFCHAEWGSSSFYLRALNVSDGTSKWVVNTGFHQTPDPVLSPDGNTLYINANSSNTLRAYDMTTTPPTQKWGLYLGSWCPAEMQSSPIVASDGYIYELGRTNCLVKISDNGSTGSVVWGTNPAGTGQTAWAQLAEGPDGSIYALFPESGGCAVHRYNPSNGTMLNQTSGFGADYYTGMAIGDNGKIYIGGRYGSGVFCFNADCSQVWNDPVPGCRFTDAALLDDGSLFVADVFGGYLYKYKD